MKQPKIIYPTLFDEIEKQNPEEKEMDIEYQIAVNAGLLYSDYDSQYMDEKLKTIKSRIETRWKNRK